MAEGDHHLRKAPTHDYFASNMKINIANLLHLVSDNAPINNQLWPCYVKFLHRSPLTPSLKNHIYFQKPAKLFNPRVIPARSNEWLGALDSSPSNGHQDDTPQEK